MVQYESFQSNAVEAPALRRWIVGGLMLSLCGHAALFYAFYHQQMHGFSTAPEVAAPARVVNMVRVKIADNTEADPSTTLAEKRTSIGDITIPSDKPVVQEITIAPQIPEMPKTFTEKPQVDSAGLDKLVKSDAAARAEMDKSLTNIAQALVTESPRMPRQPIIAASSGPRGGGSDGADNMRIPGLDSIDEKLAKFGGAMRAGERAGMPGGALFEYDSAELRQEAIDQLRKLGTLIEKNAKATFTIEGHTDSFGSPGYNQGLSERRAEAVKAWLVQNFHVAPERIATRGFGNTKPIVQSEKTMEEQAPNRRVELVVRTNATPAKATR